MTVPGAKICGLCRAEDVCAAEDAGASYLGVILSARGPRAQTLDSAAGVLAGRDRARAVGVFVDEDAATIGRAVRELMLDVVQLHGDEPIELVDALRERLDVRLWKAVRVRSADHAAVEVARWNGRVDGVLLDGYDAGAAGGTGARFDWASLTAMRAAWPAGLTFVLAGGLTPDNVAQSIDVLRPDVVDVSSGVEETTGVKSHDAVRRFIEHARAAR